MYRNVEKCQRILKTVEETKGSLQGMCFLALPRIPILLIYVICGSATDLDVSVLFNYRYNPVHWKVEEVIASGAIGNVKSVHFEWLLVCITRRDVEHFFGLKLIL